MNNMNELLSVDNKEERGLLYTPKEIAQQVKIWKITLDMFLKEKENIQNFLQKANINEKETTVLLIGAGSSEYIGSTIENIFRKSFKNVEVLSVATTSILSSPRSFIKKNRNYIVFSFARSGNSPESVASYNLINQLSNRSYQVVITCNKDGELAKKSLKDEKTLRIILAEESNDKSLVMTSSFSSMVFSGICMTNLENLENIKNQLASLIIDIEKINNEYFPIIKKFAEKKHERVLFLGDDTLYGLIKESSLKLLEMTSAKILTNTQSFLGLRHGPQVFIRENKDLVLASLSTDDYKLKYQIDLIKEMIEKKQGEDYILIVKNKIKNLDNKKINFIELENTSELMRVLSDVYLAQIFALFSSLKNGFKPDNPSITGTINRVVSGVNIYPFKED